MKIGSLKKGLATKVASYKKRLQKKSENPKNKFLIIGFIVVLLLLTVGYKFKGLLIAATVNGQPVTRVSVIKDLEKQGGKQVLDSLVTKVLITQEASKKGVNVTEDDIKKEEDNLEKTLSGQGTTLDNALSLQGLTRNDLADQIRTQKMVEGLLKDKLSISDDELKTYFDQNKTTFAKDAKFDDVKDQVRDQVFRQKLTSEYQTWITDLKKSAKINYFVSDRN